MGTGLTLTDGLPAPIRFAGGISYRNIDVVNIQLGKGNDTFTVDSTVPGTSNNIYGNGGNDTFNVTGISSGFTNIDGGTGDDIFNIGSLAPNVGLSNPTDLFPTTALGSPAGVLAGLSGLLTLTGGAGSNNLYVDDSGDSMNSLGELTGTRITGLGMGAVNDSRTILSDALHGITYSQMSDLKIRLGTGSDHFFIDSTHTATTEVYAGNVGARTGWDPQVDSQTGLTYYRDNIINIRSVSGVTHVYGGNGDDYMNVNVDIDGNRMVAKGIGARLYLDGSTKKSFKATARTLPRP
jgi:hypothetical protein